MAIARLHDDAPRRYFWQPRGATSGDGDGACLAVLSTMHARSRARALARRANADAEAALARTPVEEEEAEQAAAPNPSRRGRPSPPRTRRHKNVMFAGRPAAPGIPDGRATSVFTFGIVAPLMRCLHTTTR